MATRYNPIAILAPLLVGEECVSRIEAVVTRLAALQPAMSPSRPDLLRTWIWNGLVQAEQQLKAMEQQAARTPTTFIPQYLPNSYPSAGASAPPLPMPQYRPDSHHPEITPAPLHELPQWKPNAFPLGQAEPFPDSLRRVGQMGAATEKLAAPKKPAASKKQTPMAMVKPKKGPPKR